MDVGVHLAVEVVFGHLRHLADGGVGCAVNQHIQRTEGFDRSRHHGPNLVAPAHVADGQHRLAAALDDAIDHRLAVGRGACRNHHLGALGGKGFGDGLANAAAAAGDQHHLAGETLCVHRVAHLPR